MKKLLLLISLLFAISLTHAQDRCGLQSMTKVLEENNPQIKVEQQLYNRFLHTVDQTQAAISREILKIPIVVHVIYTNDNENIPDARIYEQIDILNKDYSRQNADRVKTPAAFQNKAGSADIQFYLTSVDESGQPTSGITRHYYENISTSGYVENIIKKETVWDTKRFLNIWVLRMPNQNILGYSYLPLPSILNSHKDGLVVDYNHFGYKNINNSGRTATHELGHYLGLKHPWGSQESCSVDDGISDTPKTDGPFYGCPSFPQSRCTESSMFMNFMDYVSDPCMNMFSKGQINVMRSVLINKRSGLINNEAVGCANLDLHSMTMGFEENEAKSLWTKEDANDDGNTWNISTEKNAEWGPNTGVGFAAYEWNDDDHTIGGDDYLFSPCIDIKKDVVYELSFSYACASDGNKVYPEKLEVGFSSSAGSRDFTIIDDAWKLDINNAFPNYEKAVFKFKTPTNTTISVGFHVTSEPNQYSLQLDNIKIRNTEVTSTNVVTSLKGINISPNPATNIIHWNILNPTYSKGKITIYDLLGHPVTTYTLESNQAQKDLDVSQLSPALYIVETVIDGMTTTNKLIVTD